MPLSLDPDREKPRKDLGRYLGLLDKPLHRDWLAWWTAFWVLVSGLSIAFPSSSAQPSSLPKWLDVPLAVLFFAFVFGFIPAYIRVLVRRGRIRRARARTAAGTSQGRTPDNVDAVQPPARDNRTSQPAPADVAASRLQERAADGSIEKPSTVVTPPAPRSEPRPAAQPVPSNTPRVFHMSSLDISELQSDATLAEASKSLPYPVARATRRLQLAGDAKEAYEAALRTGEVLATVLGITAAAWAQHERITTDNLDRLLSALTGRGIAQGSWLQAAQSIEKPMLDSQVGLPGMTEALRRVKGGKNVVSELEIVTVERNAWAHGASPQTKAEAGERLAELLPPLRRALKQCLPLQQHDWLFVESTQFQRRDATFLVHASRVMGDHPDWDRTLVTSSAAVASESFYISAPSGLIDLTPFVVMRQCPTCRQPEVAYADRLDAKRGVALKTFDRGHPLFDPALVEDVLALTEQRPHGATGTAH